MNVQFCIRVDITSTIGAGHLMRCIAIAAACERAGHKVLFISSAESKSYVNNIDAFTFPVSIINISSAVDEFDQIEKLLSDFEMPTVLILDGYHFEPIYRKALHSLAEKYSALVLALDDENKQGNLYADIISNPVNEALTLGYERNNPNSSLLLGNEFVLRQPCYLKRRDIPYTKANTLAICFGASDPFGLTLPLLQGILSDTDINDIVVITGAAYQAVDTLYAFVSEHAQNVRHFHNVGNLREQMQRSRLFVSAAGGTSFELEALAVPSILVCVASNQINAARQHEANQWCEVFDASEIGGAESVSGLIEQDISSLVSLIKHIWKDDQKLDAWHKAGSQLSISDGASNLVSEAVALIKEKHR